MQRRFSKFIAICAGSMLLGAACAASQPLVKIGPARGEIPVAMKASDFKFEPNNLSAYKKEMRWISP